MAQVAQFIFTTGQRLFEEIATSWGIIGYAIIAFFVIPRVVNFIKRFFV